MKEEKIKCWVGLDKDNIIQAACLDNAEDIGNMILHGFMVVQKDGTAVLGQKYEHSPLPDGEGMLENVGDYIDLDKEGHYHCSDGSETWTANIDRLIARCQADKADAVRKAKQEERELFVRILDEVTERMKDYLDVSTSCYIQNMQDNLKEGKQEEGK